MAALIDTSFIRKSGKQTPGLAQFYNSCINKAEKGLEISEIALLDCKTRQAYALSIKQTLDKEGQTRFDSYAEHLKDTALKSIMLFETPFPLVLQSCESAVTVVS